ncbi:putative tyrosinase-like protein tyr-3 [Bulinus truncatus]|nr:putative tyrosinase-like protein tyr-3 [Bulinus truncatus]
MITPRVLVVIVTLFSCLYFTSSEIRPISIPVELQHCYNRVHGIGVDEYVGSIYSWFCEHSMHNSSYDNVTLRMNADTAQYVKELLDVVLEESTNVNNNRTKRQARPCIRREYRMLTLNERRRYHNVVNILKRDTAVRPNRHDALSNIHQGVTNLIAHGGPGFLGWHRVYLSIYEAALRRVDPTVCLPYWDSTLDNRLANPFLSSLWSAEFLGTPRGRVVSGPFANWRLPSGAQLIRNVGVDGQLISTAQVQSVLARRSYAEIVTSDAPNIPANLEIIHGGPHIFVGGAMSQLDTAAFDPVFFLHHAFIDLIFERFRARLRSINVNPDTYPNVGTNSRHVATAPTGFPEYNQARGYSQSLASRVSYQPVPTCSATSRSCGDRFLVCQLSSGRCIPTTRTSRKKRSVKEPNQYPITTSEPATTTDALVEPNTCDREPAYGLPYQNDYCIGQTCDTTKWAMVPVRVVSVRPPKFQSYNSFPVWSGSVDDRMDIYSPSAYNQTKKFIADVEGHPLTYSRCHDEPAGQIFVYSHGMNYAGYYKESTIVDQKLPVSVSMGYIGVKKPTAGLGGVSKALLRAHDSCGRVCHVACKDPYTNEFKICSGAVAVSDVKPLMFGDTLAEAVTSIFDYKFDSESPRFQADNVFITFFCDYRKKFPFDKPEPMFNTTYV